MKSDDFTEEKMAKKSVDLAAYQKSLREGVWGTDSYVWRILGIVLLLLVLYVLAVVFGDFDPVRIVPQ